MKLIKAVLAVLVLVLGFFAVRYYLYNMAYPLKYGETITKYAAMYHIDEHLVMSIVNAESRYDKDAVSSQGAAGLMQITKSTAEWIAKSMGDKSFTVDKLRDPETNIRMGCWYFDYLSKKFAATELVLAAYNAGPGNVNDWLDKSIISKDGTDYEKMPFKETGKYVKKVIADEKMYEFLY